MLETAEISPTATPEQRAALAGFLHGPPRRTDTIHTACVEICETKYDRLTLTVIDTPGLDFARGRELTLERQVSTIVRYMDGLFADTLNEVRVYPSHPVIPGALNAQVGIQSCPAKQRRPTRSFVSPLSR